MCLTRGCETCCQSSHFHMSLTANHSEGGQAVWTLQFWRVTFTISRAPKVPKSYSVRRVSEPYISYWWGKYCKANNQLWAVPLKVAGKAKGLKKWKKKKKCTCWERKSCRNFSAEVKCIIEITPTQAVWEICCWHQHCSSCLRDLAVTFLKASWHLPQRQSINFTASMLD